MQRGAKQGHGSGRTSKPWGVPSPRAGVTLGSRSAFTGSQPPRWRRYVTLIVACAAILVLADLAGLTKRHSHQIHHRADSEADSDAEEGLHTEADSEVTPEDEQPASGGSGEKNVPLSDKGGGSVSQNELADLQKTTTDEAMHSSYRYERPDMPWAPQRLVYRKAPWKPAVGAWMKSCHAKAKEVDYTEVC